MINENGIQQRVYVIASQRHIHANVTSKRKERQDTADRDELKREKSKPF